jgi:hypothetical protein
MRGHQRREDGRLGEPAGHVGVRLGDPPPLGGRAAGGQVEVEPHHPRRRRGRCPIVRFLAGPREHPPKPPRQTELPEQSRLAQDLPLRGNRLVGQSLGPPRQPRPHVRPQDQRERRERRHVSHLRVPLTRIQHEPPANLPERLRVQTLPGPQHGRGQAGHAGARRRSVRPLSQLRDRTHVRYLQSDGAELRHVRQDAKLRQGR